ncbi:MAG: hypothetical protein NTY08_12720 [Proteobacteria bacterium]|nr:hypothetical protein [Pseudomonadota bacterium]
MKRLLILLLSLWCPTAFAGQHALVVGPPIAGTGGSNPIGLPPALYDLEYSYVTDAGFETKVSVIPGLLFGYRQKTGGLYVSGGGGLISDNNGTAIGAYTAFGYITGDGASGWHWVFGYTQTIGKGSAANQIISPSALRIGIVF